jgi:starch synthase
MSRYNGAIGDFHFCGDVARAAIEPRNHLAGGTGIMGAAMPVRSAQQAARPSPGQRYVRKTPHRPGSGLEPLTIVHIAAECWPFARTGGLGEAVAGLAASQAKDGAAVTVIMPLYRAIRRSMADLRSVRTSLAVTIGSRREAVDLYDVPTPAGQPRMIFVGHGESFDRDGVYGESGHDYPDNAARFALLSSAAIEALPYVAPAAHIVHAHDWHAAPALAFLRERRLSHRRSTLGVLSVHNAAFQGCFGPDCIAGLGIGGSTESQAAFEWYGEANYLKGGMASADLTFTVSPNHAAEICTPEGGFGMHEQFARQGRRLVGVLNGVDAAVWDPTIDPIIDTPYSRTNLRGKAACKSALQRECRLGESPAATVFAMCTRLTEQKGLDIVLRADLKSLPGTQFVFVGRGERRYEEALAALAAQAPDRIALRLDFSDALEHRLMAGADALIMPSLFEPCGLTQMRAQRYGTIPVVRKVGGLADTVVDTVTGFVFGDYTPEAFASAVERATACHAQKRLWRGMVRRAMLRDFSWRRASDQYGEHYRAALAASRRTP